MLTLYFEVVNQHLKRIDESVLAAGSENYAKLSFSFNQDWFGIVDKTVLFEANGKPYYVPLDNNNECFIPNELLADNPRTVIISVYGGVRLTTNKLTLTIDSSGIADRGIPEPEEGTSIYDQLLYYISNAMQHDCLIEGKNIDIDKIITGLLFVFHSNHQYINDGYAKDPRFNVILSSNLVLDDEVQLLGEMFYHLLTPAYVQIADPQNPSTVRVALVRDLIRDEFLDDYNYSTVDEAIDDLKPWLGENVDLDGEVKWFKSDCSLVEVDDQLVWKDGYGSILFYAIPQTDGTYCYNTAVNFNPEPIFFPQAKVDIKYKISADSYSKEEIDEALGKIDQLLDLINGTSASTIQNIVTRQGFTNNE